MLRRGSNRCPLAWELGTLPLDHVKFFLKFLEISSRDLLNTTPLILLSCFLLQHCTYCVLIQFANKLLLKFWFHFWITSFQVEYSSRIWDLIHTHYVVVFSYEFWLLNSLPAQTLKLIILTISNLLLACCVSPTNCILRKAGYDERFIIFLINPVVPTLVWLFLIYRISSYSFLPWIVTSFE